VLSFAEVASRFDQAGGPYLYAGAAFGPLVGFQAGWLTFWIRTTSAAAAMNVFADYLAQTWAWAGTPLGGAITMTAVIAVIAAINVIGVREATWTIDLFTVAKLLPLALLVLIGLPAFNSATAATRRSRGRSGASDPAARFRLRGLRDSAAGRRRVPPPAAGQRFALLTALAVIATFCAGAADRDRAGAERRRITRAHRGRVPV
jgi:amino acid transporter